MKKNKSAILAFAFSSVAALAAELPSDPNIFVNFLD
jgi:hypothetical protein